MWDFVKQFSLIDKKWAITSKCFCYNKLVFDGNCSSEIEPLIKFFIRALNSFFLSSPFTNNKIQTTIIILYWLQDTSSISAFYKIGFVISTKLVFGIHWSQLFINSKMSCNLIFFILNHCQYLLVFNCTSKFSCFHSLISINRDW